MNGNFRWHYIRNCEYPENTGKNREALIVVKQLLPETPDDCTLVETFTSCFYTDENKFVSTLY